MPVKTTASTSASLADSGMLGARSLRKEPHADRAVPRAAGRTARRDPDARPDPHGPRRGGGGDRLVRAAPRPRAGSRGRGDHAELRGGGVQALLDGPRVPPARNAALGPNGGGGAVDPGGLRRTGGGRGGGGRNLG